MATTTLDHPQVTSSTQEKKSIFSSRRGRRIRENVTAYLFIAPAVIIIGIFGIMPVAFAIYVSLFQWIIKQKEFLGFGNYTKAIGNLAYVAGFWLALGAIIAAVVFARRLWRIYRQSGQSPWLWIPTGIAGGAAIALLVKFIVAVLPNFLGIADKIRGIAVKTREVYAQLLGEVFSAPEVVTARNWFLLILGLALVLAVIAYFLGGQAARIHGGEYVSYSMLATSMAIIGPLLGWFTYREIVQAYVVAIEAEKSVDIWPQVGTISGGLILLLAAWFVWRSAERADSTKATFIRLAAAAVLIVAGWILIGEVPAAGASGDKDIWKGLQITVWYSVGTVPFELGIGLVLATLLFQEIRGKSIYRMVFFLPYVTPSIASAAIFRVLFSNQPAAPVNSLLTVVGISPFQFLAEPKGVFTVLAQRFGLTDFPSWLAGPSLALVVIMIFNIWTYVGYNTVIYLAGLGSIPKEMYEAAAVDGAGRWSIFRHITFPLLSPTTYFLTLLATIGTFKAFNHIWVLREAAALGNTDTFSVVIFEEMKRNARYGYASALSFVLFGIILTLTLINNRIAREKVFYG